MLKPLKKELNTPTCLRERKKAIVNSTYNQYIETLKFVNINQVLATCKRTQNQLLAQQCWDMLANNVTSFARGLIPADKIV